MKKLKIYNTHTHTHKKTKTKTKKHLRPVLPEWVTHSEHSVRFEILPIMVKKHSNYLMLFYTISIPRLIFLFLLK